MKHIRKHSKLFFLALGIVLVVFVGIIDILTGPYFFVSIFYVLPIYLVTLFTGIWAGILISLASAIMWLIADTFIGRTYPNPLIPYWNMAVWLSFFLAAAITTHRLLVLNKELKRESQLARIDPLTQIGNRRHFYDFATMEIGRVLRYKHPFTVLYIDLDNFKLVNDRFGHHTGDTLLCMVASTIQNNLREVDIVARLGGDEFAVLLPETDRESAQDVIFRLHQQLLDAVREKDWQVTFSIGAVTFTSPPDSVDEMLQQVDQVMYRVKRSGKGAIKHEVVGNNDHGYGAEANALER
jgi:diguanylate cyclase (GGDEF)-like protein